VDTVRWPGLTSLNPFVFGKPIQAMARALGQKVGKCGIAFLARLARHREKPGGLYP
jgi:hypothetical protein